MHNLDDAKGKADFTLHSIEGRTAHIVAQIKKVVDVIHSQHEEHSLEPGAFTLTSLELPKLTIDELELHAKHWKFLISDDAEVRALTLRLIAEKYPIKESTCTEILDAVGFIDSAVISAYNEIFGKPIQSIFKLHKPSKKKARKKTANSQKDDLEAQMKLEIEKELEWVFLRRQDTLFQQGDEGDSLYVVSDGLLRVVREAEDGSEILLAELGRNQIIGEMAIITGEPRSATIYAVRDSELCRLSKENFEMLNKKYHILMTEIAVHITRRLQQIEMLNLRIENPVAIAIVPISPDASQFASRLARVLSKETSVLHLSRERMPSYVPEKMANALDSNEYEYELAAWLDEQDTHYDMVIFEADMEATRWSDRCVQRADRILLVGSANESANLSEVETEILLAQDPRLLVRKELVLLHDDRGTHSPGTSAWLENRDLDRHHHVSLIDNQDVKRVARFLRGKATGLVLGGGGTRGAAHAGVMKAIEELGITVDIIGGTSAGAVYGAEMALGFSGKDTFDNIKENIIKRRVLLDYTLPLVALSAGKRINKGYRKVYGDVNIEDLWTPFFCITTNVTSAKMMVHRTGSLAHYVRASSSIPGVYPPILEEDGSILVDGGVFNNVPIDVMAEVIHSGTIIAVDVGHHDDQKQNYQFGSSISGWQVLWNKINPFTKTSQVPSIAEMITRVSGLTDSNQAETRFRNADVVLRPPVSQFDTFDVDNQVEIFESGYQEAMIKLSEWNKSAQQR